jgi:hypothetical protein
MGDLEEMEKEVYLDLRVQRENRDFKVCLEHLDRKDIEGSKALLEKKVLMETEE